jgi:hypothetical protein
MNGPLDDDFRKSMEVERDMLCGHERLVDS